MATASTGWKCTHTAEITAQTATTATIKVTCYWQNDGWKYDISHVSAWVYCGGQSYKVKNDGDVNTNTTTTARASCGSYSFTVNKTHAAQAVSCYAKITSTSSYVSGTKSSTAANVSVTAKTSYSVKYAANGGSSTPATQTKWHGENLTLAASISRTGHTFKSWLSSAQNKTYAAGALYGYDEATTMTAQWQAHTYAVTYNANGGTGAPAAQTKTYGTALTLSSTVPTRTNYNFKGWATSASASAAAYQAGGSYAENTAVTLYAVWELAYQKPRISNYTVNRCDASGKADDGGSYAIVSFKWETDRAVSSITVAWTATAGNGSETIAASGSSGTVSQVVGVFSTDATYTVTVTVADSGGSSLESATLAGMAFTVDYLEGGKGVAFGKPAELENTAEFAFDVKMNGAAQVNGAFEANGDATFNSAIYDKFAKQICNGLAVYQSSGIDPNTTTDHVILTAHANGPMGDGVYYYIITVFTSGKSTASYKAQYAIPYTQNGSMYHRYFNGNWSEWRRHINADENVEFVTASSLGTNGAGYIHYSSGLCIQWGNVAIALSAKTVGSATVTFQTAFSATPSIVVTAQSTVPGTYYMETAMASPSNTSFKIYAYRTNADSGTYHRWVAIGYKA